VGALELLILLAIVMLLFGSKRVPQLGRSLGKGVRDFRKSMAEAENGTGAAEMQARKNKEGKKVFPSEAAHSVGSDAQGAETPPTTGQQT
jgi:sec-independent protein translocase protein TatA